MKILKKKKRVKKERRRMMKIQNLILEISVQQLLLRM
jgi:hypothetical protein